MNPEAPTPLIVSEDHGQHYGAIQEPDARDHALASYTSLAQAGAPAIESFYPNIAGIPVWMQNKLGACVGHAAGKSRQVTSFHKSGATAITPFSARFLYAMSKCLDGMPTIQGTVPRITAKVMRDYGCATEATCPNDTTLSHDEYTYGGKLENIPTAALAEAANGPHIKNYAFADLTEQGLKAAIQFGAENNGGVFMLVKTDKSWWTRPDGVASWNKADILPLRAPSDPATTGGHEIYPYAFDVKDGRSICIFRNSWSDQWGDMGDGWFYIDEYLPFIREIITVFDLDPSYQAQAWSYTFKNPLKLGMSGSDVVALQHALRIDGEFTYPQLTGYFGPVTFAAVEAFQSKYASDILTPLGLTKPTGYVGASTLRKLNALFSK